VSVYEEDVICITALGLATAVAPTLLDSCAAARAGITRMADLKILSLAEDESLGQEPIAGCQARYIAPGFVGVARALLLGETALADLQSRRLLSPREVRGTGIIVNLSDQFYADSNYCRLTQVAPRLPSVGWAEDCKQLIPRLIRAFNMDCCPQNHRLHFGGHTGFVRAIADAEHLLLTGQLDRCLIGAIDSCVEPRFLRAAAAKGVLKTDGNPVGFVPGEAAGFILLERVADAHSAGTEPLAFLKGKSFVSNGPDRLSDEPPDGIALSSAVDQALSCQLKSEPVASIISDLNGEEYRARDWGNAITRLRTKHNLDVPQMIPALTFGETGAAAAAVGLCLGTIAQQRGWVPRGPIIEWLSADKGSRAALCFSPSDGTQ
jgi:hypothetical protein